MNLYSLALLLFGFCSFLIGLLILLKRGDFVGKLFFVFTILISAWGVAFAYVVTDAVPYERALWSARLADSAAVWIAPVWLHFVAAFLGVGASQRKIIRFSYLVTIPLWVFSFSPYFIPTVEPILNFRFYTTAGPVFHLFLFQFCILVIYGFYLMIAEWKQAVGQKKNQIIIFFAAAAFGYSGGMLSFFPIYKIPVPQYALFLMPLYPFLMAYAVMRHGFLDTEEVLALHREKLMLMGLMTSTINHELRNPLFLVQEFSKKASLALKSGKDVEESLRSLESINKNVSRINELVARLRDFAKPNPNPGTLEEVDLKKAIHDALFFVSQELKYHNVEIKEEIPDDLSKIKGDKNQLEEIFLNLFMNALQAMPKGGRLGISATQHWTDPSFGGRAQVSGNRDKKRVIASEAKQSQNQDCHAPLHGAHNDSSIQPPTKYDIRNTNNELRIEISDTGTGIPKDELKHIFTPFYTKKEKEGTGLGLYIVKSLVEQNNGRISVESEVGKGTCFKLRFSIG